VIPVPCLIDTGVPAFMLFGSESSKILKAEGVLVGEIAKMLKCGVVKNGLEVVNPIVGELSIHYEETENDGFSHYRVSSLH